MVPPGGKILAPATPRIGAGGRSGRTGGAPLDTLGAMIKVMLVLRSLFLVFITGYTFRAMPWFTSMPKTLDEQYARCSSGVDLLVRASWFAVSWIALETLVGWSVALRRGKKGPAPADAPSPAP